MRYLHFLNQKGCRNHQLQRQWLHKHNTFLKETQRSQKFVQSFTTRAKDSINDDKEGKDFVRLFASCLPGLEPILQQELISLGFSTSSLSSGGGVSFSIPKQDAKKEIFRCHLHLGTASHLYLRVGQPFIAKGMKELYQKVASLNFWKAYIHKSIPRINIRVKATKSRLYHTKGIAERVQQGIDKALNVSSFPKKLSRKGSNHSDTDNSQDTLHILVRIHRDQVQLSMDTSTTPLHKRGYRLEGSKAPLREDLAFALIYPYCHNNEESCILIDPFCGSGTILIEGGAMLYGLPPGRLRPPPLVGSTLQDDSEWHKLVRSETLASNSLQKEKRIQILGLDRNKGAIDIAKRNAERAGILNLINLEQSALRSSNWFHYLKAKEDNCIVIATNPPFGHRIRSSNQQKSLLPLYQSLGYKILGLETQSMVHVSILAHDVRLTRQTAIPNLKIQFSSKHGGLNVFALGTTICYEDG